MRIRTLPEGVRGACKEAGGRAAIVLSADLDQVERSAVLQHELVHLERGGGCPLNGSVLWDAVSAREERRVDAEVARRLLPAAEFDVWIRCEVEAGHQVDALHVSIEWAVPTRIAAIALEHAAQRARRSIDDAVSRHPAAQTTVR